MFSVCKDIFRNCEKVLLSRGSFKTACFGFLVYCLFIERLSQVCCRTVREIKDTCRLFLTSLFMLNCFNRIYL